MRSKTSPEKTSATTPSPTNSQSKYSSHDNSVPKTLVISDKMDYDIVEDMKKTRANISLFDLRKLKQQKNTLLKALDVIDKTFSPSILLQISIQQNLFKLELLKKKPNKPTLF